MKRFLKELFHDEESTVGIIILLMLSEAIIYAILQIKILVYFFLVTWLFVACLFFVYKIVEHYKVEEYIKVFKYVFATLILIFIGILLSLKLR